MSFENEVHRLHSAGRIDQSLIPFFLPDNSIRDIEGPMWDYKVGFCLLLTFFIVYCFCHAKAQSSLSILPAVYLFSEEHRVPFRIFAHSALNPPIP